MGGEILYMGVLNNIIIMNRGDTHEISLNIETATSMKGYKLLGDDAVYFGIMDPGQPFEEALVRKKFTAEDMDILGNILIVIDPEDTLDLLPGKYFYAIKLHMDHDDINPQTLQQTGQHIDKVVTIINKTKFILCD